MSDAKLRLLKDTLDSEFSIERFQRFTRELFNGPNMFAINRDERIWLEYKNSISAYYKMASYEDGERNKILILAVELKKGSTVERARSLQRNFISKILDGSDYEAAIVAFYTPDEPNWRLSLVRLDYTITAKGVQLDLTPAKRFSYLVGKNEPKHTAIKQLFAIFEDDKNNPTIDQIEEAFSVERVTKDFFNQYKAKYLELKEYLEDNEDFVKETSKLGLEISKFAEQFAKKLMGQLAFLYFLQKKGWLGVRMLPPNRELLRVEFEQLYDSVDQSNKNILNKVFKQASRGTMVAMAEDLHGISDEEAGLLSDCFINTKYNMIWGTGEKNFIRNLFDFCNDKTELNFFHDYLEPFFYDALNKKRKNHYFKRFNCKIPFLNGGLFEPIEDYHWKDINLNIPNDIFSNKEEKGRDADGILDIFDMYNFTMNEDEPLEKEVAIDPEMLGKIFENLLDVSDRKSKGAFYTPREIVHYMCQESLINYLVNKVGVPYEDMKEFILYGEMIRDADSRKAVVREGGELKIKQSIFKNIVAIDEALKNVKVADPAVGSGAFPLGMLNEIVKARNNITEYIIKVNDKGEFGKKYEESFIRARRSEYKIKWETIKNSIFAVDIEPSAVDIAKLRLWLSVVVDQEIDENNLEPHPLPNLDQNIMVGNSLIDEFEGIKLFDESLLYREKGENKGTSNFSMQMNMLLDQSDELLDDMFKLQDRYFGEDDEEKKKEIKKEIDRIRDELIKYKLHKDGNTEGLKRYEESLKNKAKPYFIWELEFAKIFKDNGGFDIVIGNPPYVQIKKIESKKQIQKMNYKSFSLSADLYCVFLEKANTLLRDDGYGIYITSNKWLRSEYGKLIRNYFLENVIPALLVDFGGMKIFDTASVDTAIFGWNKGFKQQEFKYQYLKDANDFPIQPLVRKFSYDRDEMWIFLSQSLYRIKEKIDCCGIKLKNWDIKFYYGILTGANPVFIINKDIKESLSKGNKKIEDLIVPIYRGKDIDRYSANFEEVFLINTHNGIKKDGVNPIILDESYQILIDYFDSFGNDFKKRGEQGTNWYNLRNCAYINIFKQPKIIYADIVQDLGRFYYDEEGYYTNDTAFIIHGDKYLKFLTGVLNSKLISFSYKLFYSGLSLGEKGVRYKKEFLERLPIPIPSKKEIAEIENRVEYILKSKAESLNLYTRDIENEIDRIVYKLYDLNEDEIKVIEDYFSK